MDFEELWSVFRKKIPKRIQKRKGLNYFAENRAKFEGWLKIELCDILSKRIQKITPEKDKIDIVADDWAFELKTLNTNYNYDKVDAKRKPITDNINGVIKDIKDLKENSEYKNKAVAFIVFPLSLKRDFKNWDSHIKKISNELTKLEKKEFTFENGVSAVLYFGLI